MQASQIDPLTNTRVYRWRLTLTDGTTRVTWASDEEEAMRHAERHRLSVVSVAPAPPAVEER